jgi:hypothetical protein
VPALVDALAEGRPRITPVPWAAEGLRSPFAALAGHGEAEDLLAAVVGAVCPGDSPVAPVGLVVATSSGAISGPFERWDRGGRVGPEAPWRQLPTERVAARFGLAPATTLSVACASGTAAFAVARRWLRAGICDRVVVAGVDALSLYVHAGFAGLGALAAERCRPFAAERDGLVLGEGAAAFLLETPASARAAGRAPIAALRGCGLSQDGVHLTAPDRTGNGLARAVRAALADAGMDAGDIGAVSAHATGTVFNDAMEARALAGVFGGPVPLHALKPITGHTLGAAGALEAAALLALLAGAPPPPPPAAAGPDCPITFAPGRDPRAGLSVSAAFGGVNAAIVFARVDAVDEAIVRPPTGAIPASPAGATARASTARPAAGAPPAAVETDPVTVARAHVATDDLPLARVFPGAPPALGRADAYVRGGIAALAEVRGALGPDTAVVLASATNCRAADLRYHAGLVTGGPAHASRLHFSYTTPGGPVAEASILLGLRGPVLAFCDDPARADAEARALVASGAVPSAVALSLEAPAAFAEARAVVYARPPS